MRAAARLGRGAVIARYEAGAEWNVAALFLRD